MKKRKFTDFTQLDYFKFDRVKNNNGVFGWRYTLATVTPQFLEMIREYKNITIQTAQYKYAPEQKYHAVIIWDKCIR